jgi:hypothetical protein
VSGNFAFTLGNNAGFFYMTAYKDGAPDIAGITINEIASTDQIGAPVSVFLRDPLLPDSGGAGAGGGSVFASEGGIIR